jgi:hypothetical protein
LRYKPTYCGPLCREDDQQQDDPDLNEYTKCLVFVIPDVRLSHVKQLATYAHEGRKFEFTPLGRLSLLLRLHGTVVPTR